jgi:hypothetical protein
MESKGALCMKKSQFIGRSLALLGAACLWGAAAAPLALAGTPSAAPAAAATVICSDGASSTAGKGACSHHGGVATAKCKDGSYTKTKSHSGACAKHGGVAQFLDS